MIRSAADYFDQEAGLLVDLYERTAFDRVHQRLLPHLPEPGTEVLDIGSGSGRDAAALARRGYNVTAVEPSAPMLAAARRLHPETGIRWIRDALPYLPLLGSDAFDFIILSAVWMFVPVADRYESALRLNRLTRAGGKIAVSLRVLTGTEPGDFGHFDIQRTATTFAGVGLKMAERYERVDTLGRSGRSWTTLIFEKPLI